MDILIPFAIRASDNQYVSVDEVVSGKGCACLCPSCREPVLARKGDVLQHHFAHIQRSANDDDLCRIAFQRALLWMSVQILQSSTAIVLPSLNYTFQALGESKTVTAANQSTAEYQWGSARLESEASIAAVINVSGHQIHILLRTSGQKVITNPYSVNAELVIDLANAASKIIEAKRGYKEILRNYLIDEADNKVWLSHPRLYKRHASAMSEVAEDRETQRLSLIEENRKAQEKSQLAAKNPSSRDMERFCLRLNPNDNEDQRLEAMIGLLTHIATYIDQAGRQCFNCRMMTPKKAQFKRCPYCNSVAFGDVQLTNHYISKVKTQYVSFGYVKDSIKKSVLYTEKNN